MDLSDINSGYGCRTAGGPRTTDLFGLGLMITATFKVGKEDVLAMSMHYYASSPTVRRSRIVTQASVPFAMVLVGVLGYFRDAGFRYLILISPMVLIAVVWAVLYPWLHRSYLLQASEKLLKEPSYQKAFGTYTLSLSETRIASASPIGEGTYVWASVSRISLTPDYLFIFLAGPQGYPIARAQVPEATIQEMKTVAERMSRRAEPAAAPNEGPSANLAGSQATGGPSSLS